MADSKGAVSKGAVSKGAVSKGPVSKGAVSKGPAEPSETSDLTLVRHSLSLHLDGIRTWGIDRIFGVPELPPRSPSASETAVTPEPSVTQETSAPLGRRLVADPAALLAQVATEVAACTACRLCEGRTQTVPGVGDPRARLLFVGEAPGRDEDLQGEPFVGKAGQLLDKIIGALGFRRDEVFIANTLKCRPPNNRDPLPEETRACSPYLERQVAALAPQLIVALGKPAARLLTGRDEALGRLRGGKHSYQGVPVVVTYHPAYLLRTPAAKADCWQDLQEVVRTFGRTPL